MDAAPLTRLVMQLLEELEAEYGPEASISMTGLVVEVETPEENDVSHTLHAIAWGGSEWTHPHLLRDGAEMLEREASDRD